MDNAGTSVKYNDSGYNSNSSNNMSQNPQATVDLLSVQLKQLQSELAQLKTELLIIKARLKHDKRWVKKQSQS